MSERPNVLLGLLLASAAAAGVGTPAAIALAGGCGFPVLALTVLAKLSTSIGTVREFTGVPFDSLLFGGIAVASTLGCARTLVSFRREQRLLAAVPLEALNEGKLAEVAARAGAPSLFVAPASRPCAFCFGLRRTRVVVTSGLLTRLAFDEQAAAVWHEACHARAREPLKCLLARLAASTFFWIPALRDLLDRYLLTKELAADRLAVRQTSRNALAGALLHVSGQPPIKGAVGLSDFAAPRIDRLFDPDAQLPPLFGRHRLAMTIGIACLVALLVVCSRLT